MKLKSLLSAAVLLACAASASAITWTDRIPETGNGPLDFLHEEYGRNDRHYDYTYRNTFNILDDGFDPNMHIINSIRVDFFFADDERDGREEVDIFVGSDRVNGERQIANDVEVDGNHRNAPYSYDRRSYNITNVAGILDDMSNGYLRFRITLDPDFSDCHYDREDTWLKIAKITVKGEKVPDAGSTLVLLGAGLLGLVSIRRRFSK